MTIYYQTVDGKFEQVSGTKIYTNRAYDAIDEEMVEWDTTSPDTAGTYYPGSGSWGVTATDHVVVRERIV